MLPDRCGARRPTRDGRSVSGSGSVSTSRSGFCVSVAPPLCVSESSVAHTAGSVVAAGAGAWAVMTAVGSPENVGGPAGVSGRTPVPMREAGPAGPAAGRAPPWPPATTGESVGSSRSAGGGIGVATHPASAAITSAGVWYRCAVSFAIIFSTTATISSGRSERSDLIGRGGRFWCQMSFCATDPSGNGGLPVRRK